MTVLGSLHDANMCPIPALDVRRLLPKVPEATAPSGSSNVPTSGVSNVPGVRTSIDMLSATSVGASGSLPSADADASMPSGEGEVEGIKSSLDELSAAVEGEADDDSAAKAPEVLSSDPPSSDAKKPKKGMFSGIFGSSKGKMEVQSHVLFLYGVRHLCASSAVPYVKKTCEYLSKMPIYI